MSAKREPPRSIDEGGFQPLMARLVRFPPATAKSSKNKSLTSRMADTYLTGFDELLTKSSTYLTETEADGTNLWSISQQ